MQRREPRGSISLLAQERRAHEAFARTRRRAYVEKRAALEHIDRHVLESPLHPLVITGPSGSGKSALLARWSARFGETSPEIPIISHFVGNGVIGVETSSLLRHLMLDLVERFSIGEAIATENERLPDQFLSWLPRLRGRPVVFLVDGINHIVDDSDRGDILSWIPDLLPSNVRVIISTTEGPILDEARRRAWDRLRMEPLDNEERQHVARKFLETNGDGLLQRSGFVDQVLNRRRSSNPLFLRTSLEELRFLEDRGDGAGTSQTADYLNTDDLTTLFDRILQRIEAEFGVRLVSTTLRLIDASRNGLSSEELAGLCGVSLARIERFLARLDYQLIDRDGLHTFFHDHFRQAVIARYIHSDRSRKASARKLGTYFRTQAIGGRRASEEMSAWMKGEYLLELKKSLANLPLLHYLWEHELRNDVSRYWGMLQTEKPISVAEVYRPELTALQESLEVLPDELLSYYDTVVMLGFAFNEYVKMEEIIRAGIRWGEEQVGECATLQQMRRFLGGSLREQGRWDESDVVLNNALERAIESGGEESAEVGEILAALALTHGRKEEHEEAIDLYRRSYEILRRRLGEDHPETIHVLIDLLAGYQHLGVEEEEERIYHDLLERARLRLGEESHTVALLLHNRGMSLGSRGKLPEGRELIGNALRITRGVFGHQHPNALYHILGLTTIERMLGNYEETERGLAEAFDLVKITYPDDHPNVFRVMSHIAHLRMKQGEHEEAEKLYREVLDVISTLFGEENPTTTTVALNLATILTRRGDHEAARPYFERYMPLVDKVSQLNEPDREVWEEALGISNDKFQISNGE